MKQPGIIVVAALIENNGRVLVCQRKPGGRHPLKWEFPGGKVEPGESPRAALQRELHEELAIDAKVGQEIVRYVHQYGRRSPLLLIFYRVEHFQGALQNKAFEQIDWVEHRRLREYDFLDGDVDFVRRIARGEF